MTQRYASRTTVTVERSKAEVEHILRRYGADQFLHGWEPGRAILEGHPLACWWYLHMAGNRQNERCLPFPNINLGGDPRPQKEPQE